MQIIILITSALTYYINTFLCKVKSWFLPSPQAPQVPDYSDIYTSPGYNIHRIGDCDRGTYIEIYVPDIPYRGESNDGPYRSVIYLHGFAMGPSRIYGTHLQHLVKQGYYVFYPNFQKGFCKFPPFFIQTLEDLINEVMGSGVNPQDDWLKTAIQNVKGAYEQFLPEDSPVETYLFGHSLGGLFALSWPYFVKQENSSGSLEKLLPEQVLVADPIPSTAIDIPGPLGKIVEKFTDVVDVKKTGQDLTMPVAILHGNEDAIVSKQKWKEYFPSIKTDEKKMYLSFSDAAGCPAMYANHEQATVDLSFFTIFLQLTALDGVGVENNLNWRYIWFALDRAIRYGQKADRLTFDMGTWSNGESVKPISVFLSGSN